MGGSGQTRLTLGLFTLYPAFGCVQPNGHQTVTVDYVAESEGVCEEVSHLQCYWSVCSFISHWTSSR